MISQVVGPRKQQLFSLKRAVLQRFGELHFRKFYVFLRVFRYERTVCALRPSRPVCATLNAFSAARCVAVGVDGEASECALLPPGHPLGDAAAAAATRQPVRRSRRC